MSLLKRLLTSVSLVICVILAGTLWFGLDGIRGLLHERLQADAETAASTLALSFSLAGAQAPEARSALVDTVMAAGQFQRIVYTDRSGNTLAFRERPPGEAGGRWLGSVLPTVVVTASSSVKGVDGGVGGEVVITADSSRANAVLGKLALEIMLLVLVGGALLAFSVVALMRRLEAALDRDVAARLQAIADAAPNPGAPASADARPLQELARVQSVIESVHARVRARTEAHGREVHDLRAELHSDDVTGIANRKYFINELRRRLQTSRGDASPDAYGHVLVFRQRDLAAINSLHDRQQTDEWLRRVAVEIGRVIEHEAEPERPKPQLARINGSDFVVLLAGYDGPDTIDLIEALRKALNRLRIQTAEGRLCRWSYALTDYAPGCEVSHVLARLDQGLMRAESAGHDEVEYIAASDGRDVGREAAGETAWKRLIQRALANGQLELVPQPARYRDDDITDRYEAYLTLHDDMHPDKAISGYLFMPPAIRLGLSGACDLRAAELALRWVRENPGYLAFRVSLASLLHPDFLPSMERILLQSDATPQERARLAIEIDAHGFVAYPDELAAFCRLATQAGVGIGVRRLAEQPAALLRLHKVSIRYVKLGGELIASLLESPGATQLIAAITEAAIGQGVKIYAHDVPNASTAALLREYGVLLPEDEAFTATSIEDLEGEFVDQ